VGSWRGEFEAKRATVTLPKGSPDATWADDDGKVAAGSGTVQLEIDPGGMVSGDVSGALGKLTIRGMLEQDALRAGLAPSDPSTEPAMTGVLVGKWDGKGLKGTLRVSSHDARLVRAADVQLERK
jgi:hypothetical protein